jgi:predicted nucleic acid-binding protein
MRIYLDNCCFNRPFDSQEQSVIVMESEAVLTIIDKCKKNNNYFFLGSDILDEEIDNMADPIRKQNVLNLYSFAQEHIELEPAILKRAIHLQSFNLGVFDALHLASAEHGKADIFLTTDRKLMKQTKKIDLFVDVSNPLVWLLEAML